jgi:hypothetical protein
MSASDIRKEAGAVKGSWAGALEKIWQQSPPSAAKALIFNIFLETRRGSVTFVKGA